MNTRKLEIWFVVFFLILCGIGWFFSDRSVRNELEKLLISEDRNFQAIKLKQLKIVKVLGCRGQGTYSDLSRDDGALWG